ncbi:ergothioneine biosynthesis glutamate--cysteine ligase EgtA [Nocardia shimofusensis]|uniref:ergothioneine biosynthesis glutamate--cysteine ligase EgtA n=1 Tax=Nocardia shimofusensis TaxID=228596 RepID=UPI0008334565|nr:ergothioneine biosynthesis glutamate--cysteine ligase EgtA [Nocardia shimofusensis]
MAVTLEHQGTAGLADSSGALSSRAAAEAFLGGVCFKLGPPALIGAELEWLTVQGECPASGPIPRPRLSALAAALGPHAPLSLDPGSPALPLPGGSRVTVEPGGQIELSSDPFTTAADLCDNLRADARLLTELLAAADIKPVARAADADRCADRVLRSPRYRAMERFFAGIGPFGKLMMCNTAATQVSVDAGADAAEVAARWTMLYAAGPALVAAFACSPDLRGAPPGDWASQRMRTWLRLDNTRTRPPVQDWPDPITGYARWALDVPLLCLRRPDEPVNRSVPGCPDWSPPPGATFADWMSGALDDEVGRRPGTDDLRYHLTTLFPPVRASGYFEIRYLDAQPGEDWTVPVHLFDALLSTRQVVAEATRLAASTAGQWSQAARCGLTDPEIRGSAADLLELAAAHARTPAAATDLAAAARRCRAGRTPADEPIRVLP